MEAASRLAAFRTREVTFRVIRVGAGDYLENLRRASIHNYVHPYPWFRVAVLDPLRALSPP